jgi:hypothetical protein
VKTASIVGVIVILIIDAAIALVALGLGAGPNAAPWWYRAMYCAIGINLSAAVLAGWLLSRKDQEGWAILVALFVVPLEVILLRFLT